MSPALSSLNSPRPSISAPPAHVLPQRTFSGRIRRFISPFPPPRLLPPAWSLARRPPSWPRFYVRSRLGKCVSLDWNSSGRLTKSKYFPTATAHYRVISLHLPLFPHYLLFCARI